MSQVRIIPCLDMIDGRVVKGKKFENIADVNSPDILAQYYCKSGADEIVFYDINASIEGRKTDLKDIAKIASKINIPFCVGGGISSIEGRKTDLEYITKIASKTNIPFCVGGGISSIEDIERCIKAGADKVSINSAAIKNPDLIKEAATKFGSKSIVLAIDVKKNKEGSWNVYLKGGKEDTGLDAIKWVKKVVDLGAGEIVVNSIDGDGMKEGYDIELLKRVKGTVNVPIIASGGAGKFQDFYEVIVSAKVDGVLAASVFHFGEIKIHDLKRYLKDRGISITH